MPDYRNVVLILLAGSLFLSTALRQTTANAQQGNTPVKMPAGIIVSPETTVISGPALSPRGIDFLAAINNKMKEGVTPENNADVLLVQAIGSDLFPSYAARDAYCAELGISVDSLSRESFVPPIGDALAQLKQAATKPWTESEFPAAASWLKSWEAILDVVHEASRRPNFYSPLVVLSGDASHPHTIAALLPTLQTYRTLGTALVARSMLRTQQGQIDDAWSDLIAGYRLGRLIRHHPTEIGGLVGTVIEASAAEATILFAHVGNLKADEARRFREEFAQLPASVPLSDKINFTTRLTCLDCACFLAENGLSQVPLLSMEGAPALNASTIRNLQNAIDWNEVLRRINQRYDRMHEAMTQETFILREQAISRIIAAQPKQRVDLKRIFAGERPQQSTEEQLIDALIDVLVGPQLERYSNAGEKLTARLGQVPITLALAEFRAKHDKYPQSLKELSPEFLPEVPIDHYSGRQLKYSTRGNGYRLIASGPNRSDDFGLEDDVGTDTSEFEVISRFSPSDIPVGTILTVVSGGAGTILLFVVGILSWQKLSSGKKRGKQRKRKGSTSSRARRSATGAPQRRSQRRNR